MRTVRYATEPIDPLGMDETPPSSEPTQAVTGEEVGETAIVSREEIIQPRERCSESKRAYLRANIPRVIWVAVMISKPCCCKKYNPDPKKA